MKLSNNIFIELNTSIFPITKLDNQTDKSLGKSTEKIIYSKLSYSIRLLLLHKLLHNIYLPICNNLFT